MKKIVFAIAFLGLLFSPVFAKNEKSYLRKGNALFKKKSYEKAEINYKKALSVNPNYRKAIFNLGDALYKQGRYESAAKEFLSLLSSKVDNKTKSQIYYNLGNSLLKARKIAESVEAYKNALKLNPKDANAKYNLAYALKLLKNQSGQNRDNKNQKQNQKQNQNQRQRSQNGQKNKKQEQKQRQNQNKEKQNKDQQKQARQNSGQKSEKKLSKKEAAKILQALSRKEKAALKKLKKRRAAQNPPTGKKW